MPHEQLRPNARRYLAELSPDEEEHLRRMVESFEKKESPALEFFSDVFGKQEIAQDQSRVDSANERFEREDSMEAREQKFLATAIEMIIMEFGNTWLPGYITKATEFDDKFNGTDLFLETEDYDGNIHRLAFDVTSSIQKTDRKLKDIKDQLQNGRLQKIKYFQSEIDSTKGMMEMPRVVVGAGKREAMGLIHLYLNEKNAPIEGGYRQRQRESIERHPFGDQLLTEIKIQLERWIDILEKAPANPEKIKRAVSSISNILKVVNESMENKKALSKEDAQGGNGVLDFIEKSLA